MTYSTGEALILGLLRDMPEFDNYNASRQNWKVLNSGRSDHYAILRPGAPTLTYDGMGRAHVHTQWRTVVEVWQRWKDDSTTTIALQDLWQAVVNQLEAYPTLGDETGSVGYAVPVGGSEMLERWLNEGGPVWAVWEVYIDWQEERAANTA